MEFKKTKGFTRLVNYFLEVIRKDAFKDEINLLIKEFNPKNENLEYYELMANNSKLEKVVEELCVKYSLSIDPFKWIIIEYLGTFDWDIENINNRFALDVCDITETLSAEFPIIIEISPYASMNDIKSFISNNTNYIKGVQNKYKNPDLSLNSVRSKPRQEIHDFVHQNKEKPLAEIARLLSRQGIHIDQGHISKIISIEKRRRS